jgi:hypothetical protein
VYVCVLHQDSPPPLADSGGNTDRYSGNFFRMMSTTCLFVKYPAGTKNRLLAASGTSIALTWASATSRTSTQSGLWNHPLSAKTKFLEMEIPALTIVGGTSSLGGPRIKLRRYWFDVFRASRDVTRCKAGPKTRGGFIVEMVKLGFSFSKKSQPAFSAKVLLAANYHQHI